MKPNVIQMESPGTRSLVLFPAVLIQPFPANVNPAYVDKSEGCIFR